MAQTTLAAIISLVQIQLGVTDVSENDRFVEDLRAESADIANIVASAEEKFDVIITESQIATIKTPLDLFELVNAK